MSGPDLHSTVQWVGLGGVVAHKVLEAAQVLGLIWDSDFKLGLVNHVHVNAK